MERAWALDPDGPFKCLLFSSDSLCHRVSLSHCVLRAGPGTEVASEWTREMKLRLTGRSLSQ